MRIPAVSEEAVRAYCAMYGIAATDEEMRELPQRLKAVLADLRTLRQYDASESEMAVVFPVDAPAG
ncbi:MAG TPA: hypothetical protein VGQ42_02585 [Candidatus Dormibacteraeota bacterium]|jgi:hypothetical protein|nr:hypothetical protein [Candidatus Dormibacteraeota bacterium]